ncbi:MAG: tetratricopeptide repeat protein [Bacteroidetes bacterium]|nr:tetratricopeptide repeat protein [Bacteroidota bacterium]
MNTSFKKLVKELNVGIDERKKLEEYKKIIAEKVHQNANEALQECITALKLAEEINSSDYIAYYTHQLGNCYHAISEYDKAEENILKAIELYTERNDTKNLIACNLNLANVYIHKKNYRAGLKYLTESYRLNQIENSPLIKARLLNNFGVVYMDTENFKKALKYFLECIKISKEIDSWFDLQSCYVNIGMIYKKQKDYKNSLKYFSSALELNGKIKDKYREGYILYNYAEVYFEQGEMDKALNFSDMSLKNFEEIGDKSMVAANYVFKGKVLNKLENFDDALINCNLGLLISNQLNDERSIAETKFILAELHYKSKNIEKAIILAYDSILSASKTNMNDLLYCNYEFLSKVFLEKGDYKTSLEYKTKQFEKYEEIHKKEIDRISNNLIMQFEIEKLDYETSKLKEEKNKLTMLNEKLESLNKEKNEFIGILAHDLRNPLGAIYSLAEIYLGDGDALDPDQKEIMQEIKISSDKMLNLISNLLNLNAIDSGKMEGNISEVNLSDIVSRIIKENSKSANAKGISISVSKPHYEIKFSSYKIAIEQILTNILSNAIKYTFPNKNVFIGVYENKENEPVCEIMDEGPGFTDRDKELMFQKFAKLSAKPTGGENSVGLGLSIVKKLADLTGARIHVESTHGKGAKFVVIFKNFVNE